MQLIEDKKALAERCEAVVAELKQGDQRRKDREAQVQEQHELVSPLGRWPWLEWPALHHCPCSLPPAPLCSEPLWEGGPCLATPEQGSLGA